MSEPALFLDATLFLRAAGQPHRYKEPCARILADAEAGILSAVTDAEVLHEILDRTRRAGVPAMGVELCRAISQYPFPILPVTAHDIALAVELFAVHRGAGLRPRDAVHGAILRNHSIARVIGTDSRLDALPFVQRIDPLEYRSP